MAESILERIIAAGGFISLPDYCGGGWLNINPSEVEAYLRDPVGYCATLHGVNRNLVVEYRRHVEGGAFQCVRMTGRGKRCKNRVFTSQVEFAEFAYVMDHGGQVCRTHGGITEREAWIAVRRLA